MRWSFPAVLDDAQRASLGCSVALSGARLGRKYEGLGENLHIGPRQHFTAPADALTRAHAPYHHTSHSQPRRRHPAGTHRAGRLSLLHLRYGCATSQLPPATIESLEHSRRDLHLYGGTRHTRIALLSPVMTTSPEQLFRTVILEPKSRPHPSHPIRRSSQSILRDLATAYSPGSQQYITQKPVHIAPPFLQLSNTHTLLP
ncbi:hypothetical protein V496_09355, partial [Pseudogymnoascus sp. VKM F-4515 (FW-2607)]